MGEKLLASAAHFRLFRDRAFVARVDADAPRLRRGARPADRPRARPGCSRASATPRTSPTRSTASTPRPSSGRGCAGWRRVWAATGERALARRCAALAARLGPACAAPCASRSGGSRTARCSSRSACSDDEEPYGSLTETRLGSYWNLVMPYALASGLFPPRGPQANGVLALHAAARLAAARARARRRVRALRPSRPSPSRAPTRSTGSTWRASSPTTTRPTSSCSSLYGQLAAAMTPGTFVAGEAASVAPLRGA